MKRLLSTLLVLFAIYYFIQFSFQNFGKGHEGQYTITDSGKTFSINEKLVSNVNGEIDNYYIKVTVDDSTFEFQTFSNYYGRQNIIKKVMYYDQNNLKCLLPIFDGDKFEFDMMCLKDGVMTPYYTLQGTVSELDIYAKSLLDIGYKPIFWQDTKTDSYTDESVTAYGNNIVSNHYLGINSYRGLYTISKDNLKPVYAVKLFKYDIYKRPISGIVGKYYITADYGQQYSFNQLYVVDLTNNDESTIDILPAVDFDGYVQGVVDGSLYFYDRVNRRQYEVSTNPVGIKEVGSADNGILFYNEGKWSTITAPARNAEDIIFNPTIDDQIFMGYDRVDKIGNTLSGHYYLYKKNGSVYDVYRVNIQNLELKTYVFSTNKISNINYVDDYVYYSYNNEVKYFHNSTGIKTLFKNTEFDFNSSLYFNVYKK
jgi:hypothetical protein